MTTKFQEFCCCSVAKVCLTLCDPMNCSMPHFPVLYYQVKKAIFHLTFHLNELVRKEQLSSPLKGRRKGCNMTGEEISEIYNRETREKSVKSTVNSLKLLTNPQILARLI